MRTVPLPVLALAPLKASERKHLAKLACVELGVRVEVDLEAADTIVPGSARVLTDYWRKAQEMLSDLAAGREREDAVVMRRVIAAKRQTDTKSGRADLADELFALTGHPRLVRAVGILESAPNWKELARVGTLRQGESTSSISVTLPSQGLPEQLGGARARNEVRRRVTVEASHAQWRDRKARRLVSVNVSADEVWPLAA